MARNRGKQATARRTAFIYASCVNNSNFFSTKHHIGTALSIQFWTRSRKFCATDVDAPYLCACVCVCVYCTQFIILHLLCCHIYLFIYLITEKLISNRIETGHSSNKEKCTDFIASVSFFRYFFFFLCCCCCIHSGDRSSAEIANQMACIPRVCIEEKPGSLGGRPSDKEFGIRENRIVKRWISSELLAQDIKNGSTNKIGVCERMYLARGFSIEIVG